MQNTQNVTSPVKAEENNLPSKLQKRLEAIEALKAHPGDAAFISELQNPQFKALLRAGVDARTAYDFLHRDDELQAIVSKVANSVRAQTLRELRAQNARPLENGTTGRAPATIRDALPSEWSREERERVGRAALRGKKHTISD